MRFQSSKSRERSALLKNSGWALAGAAILAFGVWRKEWKTIAAGAGSFAIFGLWVVPAGLLRYFRQDGIDLEPDEIRLRLGGDARRIRWDKLEAVDCTWLNFPLLRIRLREESAAVLEKLDRKATGFDIIISGDDVALPLDRIAALINFYLQNPETRPELADDAQALQRVNTLPDEDPIPE